MKTSFGVASALTVILTATLARPNLLPAQEDGEKGWTTLFNGKDLDGWKFHLGREGVTNDGTFTAKDGILMCSGKPSGYMYTAKSYSNFTLQFEFAFKKPEGLKSDSEFRGNTGKTSAFARGRLMRPANLIRSLLGQNAVPAFPVRTPDELVGFRRITGAQVDVVPLELLPGPVGHVAEVVRLGDPA